MTNPGPCETILMDMGTTTFTTTTTGWIVSSDGRIWGTR